MSDIKTALIDRRSQSEYDYFVEQDGLHFAGYHLLVEFWGAEGLNDVPLIKAALRRAADMAEATVLSIHVHKFSQSGVTGIAVLAESHISIHTWPERGFAAIDIFMCGNCHPYDAIEPLKEALSPGKVLLTEHRRGTLP